MVIIALTKKMDGCLIRTSFCQHVLMKNETKKQSRDRNKECLKN